MKCNYFRAQLPLLMSRRFGVTDDDDDGDGDDGDDDDDDDEDDENDSRQL